MLDRVDRPVLIVQHTALAHPATLLDALAHAGVAAAVRQLHAGSSLPDTGGLDEFEAAIILGGAMNTDEEETYPFLADERRLIVAAVRRGMPLLGICLGAQQLARAFGGHVYQRETPEVGWLPLRIVANDALFAGLPSPFEALEWHAQSFTAPPGATVLALRTDHEGIGGGGASGLSGAAARGGTTSARGELRDVQAFRVGRRAWGLQFHPEVDASMLDAWLAHDNKGLRDRDPALWQATYDARHDIVRHSRTLCRTLIENFVATF